MFNGYKHGIFFRISYNEKFPANEGIVIDSAFRRICMAKSIALICTWNKLMTSPFDDYWNFIFLICKKNMLIWLIVMTSLAVNKLRGGIKRQIF